jgi:hypothetical protein
MQIPGRLCPTLFMEVNKLMTCRILDFEPCCFGDVELSSLITATTQTRQRLVKGQRLHSSARVEDRSHV